jgi:3-oxoacyl-[acyl-carrier-protein] synthase-3
MKFKFQNKRISGILTVVPKNEIRFEDEAAKFNSTPKQMKRLKEVMGFDRRRIADKGTLFSDLAVFGIEKLLDKGVLKKEDIGAMLLITQSPDYFLPPTSNVVQGRLNLSRNVYSLDINNGCAGYIVGLIQAFQLLEHMTDKKVLLIAGEVAGFRRRAKQEDISNANTNRDSLLWGDAVAISVVENDFAHENPIIAEVELDATRWDSIVSPAKSFKKFDATQAHINISDFKSSMNGGEVFRFTQVEVPPAIERNINDSGMSKEEIDWFLFHQPNKFLVETVAAGLKVPLDKTPSNVVSKFGNAASATIPTNICLNLTPDILQKSFNVCMAGFGTGLAVGVMTMKFGSLNICEIVEY